MNKLYLSQMRKVVGVRQDDVEHVKAQVQEVADVTGAGNTVIATFALMLACGFSMAKAMEITKCAGGFVVSKFKTSTVSYEELFVCAALSINSSEKLISPGACIRCNDHWFTNGVFDLLHGGYMNHRHKVAKLGASQIAAVNSDA